MRLKSTVRVSFSIRPKHPHNKSCSLWLTVYQTFCIPICKGSQKTKTSQSVCQLTQPPPPKTSHQSTGHKSTNHESHLDLNTHHSCWGSSMTRRILNFLDREGDGADCSTNAVADAAVCLTALVMELKELKKPEEPPEED